MDAKKWIKPCVLFFSAVLHGVLLFCIVFHASAKKRETEEAVNISLVNIDAFEEAPPAPPPPAKKAVKPQIREEPVRSWEPIAEQIIEIEEPPEEPSEETGVDEADGLTEGAEGGDSDSKSNGTPNGAAEAAAAYSSEYIRSNYTYIQQRVMRELIYPSKARRAGIQGMVEIVFIINIDGSASGIAVRKSSGKSILDDEAIRAVKSASPFRGPERPVRIVIPVSFKLT